MGVFDPTSSAAGRRVYLAANHAEVLSGCYMLVSTDNGVTYLPPDATNNPTADIGAPCIGRFAVDPNTTVSIGDHEATFAALRVGQAVDVHAVARPNLPPLASQASSGDGASAFTRP